MKKNKNLEEIFETGNKILKILYILIVIGLLYIITLIIKEWKILPVIFKILSIISPFFIGFLIAWTLNPLVTKLKEKGMKRGLAVCLVYIVVIALIVIFMSSLVPVLAKQINELVSAIPGLILDIRHYIDNLFLKLSDSTLYDLQSIKVELYAAVETFGKELTTRLPSVLMKIVESVASGIGTILISFVVGFYLLFNFNNVNEHFLNIIPIKHKKDAKYIISEISRVAHKYVSGTMLISIVLFLMSAIGFALIGLEGSVLFAAFCAITNLIPYVGPYIGGIPAVFVGFSQSPLIGFLTLIFILISQLLENNFLHPVIIGKQMDLHPVTIMLALLVFGHFFGIIGMIIATPIIAILKVIYLFLDSKLDFFGYGKETSLKAQIGEAKSKR